MKNDEMDSLELSLGTSEIDGYRVVDIFVNGRNLIDLVREVELPYAQQEGVPDMAGRYEGLPPTIAYLPSRHLLNQPEPAYSGRNTVYLLVCGMCGEPGCWPFESSIVLTKEVVVWTNFAQPHRRDAHTSRAVVWNYDDLGEFVFDRAAYERELQPQKKPRRAVSP